MPLDLVIGPFLLAFCGASLWLLSEPRRPASKDVPLDPKDLGQLADAVRSPQTADPRRAEALIHLRRHGPRHLIGSLLLTALRHGGEETQTLVFRWGNLCPDRRALERKAFGLVLWQPDTPVGRAAREGLERWGSSACLLEVRASLAHPAISADSRRALQHVERILAGRIQEPGPEGRISLADPTETRGELSVATPPSSDRS